MVLYGDTILISGRIKKDAIDTEKERERVRQLLSWELEGA